MGMTVYSIKKIDDSGMSMLICKLTAPNIVAKLRIIYKHIVTAASILNV